MIVLDSGSGKLFSLFWGESDGFKETQMREISLEEAREECRHGDFITVKPLDEALAEHRKDDG
jgi:hypothetical protein